MARESSLNIPQWNCRNANNKKGPLEHISNNFGISLLNETCLKFYLRSINIIRKQVNLTTNFNDKLELLATIIPTELAQILIINFNKIPVPRTMTSTSLSSLILFQPFLTSSLMVTSILTTSLGVVIMLALQVSPFQMPF